MSLRTRAKYLVESTCPWCSNHLILVKFGIYQPIEAGVNSGDLTTKSAKKYGPMTPLNSKFFGMHYMLLDFMWIVLEKFSDVKLRKKN